MRKIFRGAAETAFVLIGLSGAKPASKSLRGLQAMFKDISKKRQPGTFAAGATGVFLRKVVIPSYRVLRGRQLDQLQAEWMVQGLFSRQWQRRYNRLDRMKRPYKDIRCDTEFGPELKYYLPYAYWHYLNGTLRSTSSFKDTAPFYFFSPRHIEREGQRQWVLDPEIPNSEDHNFSYSYRRWAQVPLRAHYQSALNFGFSKPILIVSNKFNREWNAPPVNFLSLDALSQLFDRLTPHYTVVYNRPGSDMIVVDHNDAQSFNDKTYLRRHYPNVFLAEDLYAQYRDAVTSFNHFQLALYAQCERFISVQGGNSILASYFGGTNLIFQRKGQEIFFNELDTIYPRLAGTNCIGSSSYEDLLKDVETRYLSSCAVTN